MLTQAISAWRRLEVERSAARGIGPDLRLPTALVVGLLGSGSPSPEDVRLATAFATSVRQCARDSWPEVLSPDGPILVVAFPEGAKVRPCDFIVSIDQDPEGFGPLPPMAAGLPMIRLSAGDPEFVGPFSCIIARDELSELRSVQRLEQMSVAGLARIVFWPPGGARGRERIVDFLREGPPRTRRRFEYDLLLRLLGPREKPRTQPAVDAWASAERLAATEPGVQKLEDLRRAHDYADAHAVYYGDAWRSIVVARSTLLLAPTVVSGAIGIADPSLSSLTALTQILIILRIFFDRRRAARERWQDKWIDYRDLAERLRCLRYLALCGGSLSLSEDRQDASWVAWFATRFERATEQGSVGDARHTELLSHLLEIEIKDQIFYHRAVVRRFCALDLRLRRCSRAILMVSSALGALLLVAGLARFGIRGVPWPALTSLGLSVAPALVANLNGFRGEFDMVRQGERSARAASRLARLAREASGEPLSASTIQATASKAARIMIGDTVLWRNTLETRAARLSRR